MAGRAVLAAAGAVFCAQTPTTASFRAIFTVPSDADNSVPLIPNINDPQAVNAQDVCPGYKASNIVRTPYGLKAQLALAGAACNVYGTDIEALNLTVEYQSDDRLHVGITPTYVDSSNSSWYILPEVLVTKPTIDVKKKPPPFFLAPLLEAHSKERY
jgi:alpha-glucosidase